MRVNLVKYIADTLPVRLQPATNIEFIRALLRQVVKAHNDFTIKVPDWLCKANTNASVIALQHHIQREFDVDAVITELDGKPIDFLVSVNGFVDETALKSLISQYKLAGKSFTFKVGAVTYTAAFSDWLCEDIKEVYTAAFSDYECEDDGVVHIYVNVVPVDVDFKIVVTASRNVGSDVQVSVLPFYPEDHPLESYTLTIFTGANMAEHLFTSPIVPPNSNVKTWSRLVTTSNDYYTYIIHN